MDGEREPRIYPLMEGLTEEQVAVTFAMTSRRPEPFDEIAVQVTETKAADFNEKWVLGYGHNSVAEHAVLHLAVEDISRLACDDLEDNRLGAYTEKSSRYQRLDGYRVPPELSGHPEGRKAFIRTCDTLFQIYDQLVDQTIEWLKGQRPKEEKESDTAYGTRLRREAVDSCRLVLPAGTLTNVGVTMNARSMEHAISKLLSSRWKEMQWLGQALKDQAQTITPTLVKYAEESSYLTTRYDHLADWSPPVPSPDERYLNEPKVKVVIWDQDAERRLVAALLFRQSDLSYGEIWNYTLELSHEVMDDIIAKVLEGMGDHDAPPREFEMLHLTFDLLLDYGAYREYKRHRMQTYIPQRMTMEHGFRVPQLLEGAGLTGPFLAAMKMAELGHRQVEECHPYAAQYLVTHGHFRRVLMTANLRELYHLFKLRTSKFAHFSIREPMLEAMRQALIMYPSILQGLRLREGA